MTKSIFLRETFLISLMLIPAISVKTLQIRCHKKDISTKVSIKVRTIALQRGVNSCVAPFSNSVFHCSCMPLPCSLRGFDYGSRILDHNFAKSFLYNLIIYCEEFKCLHLVTVNLNIPNLSLSLS